MEVLIFLFSNLLVLLVILTAPKLYDAIRYRASDYEKEILGQSIIIILATSLFLSFLIYNYNGYKKEIKETCNKVIELQNSYKAFVNGIQVNEPLTLEELEGKKIEIIDSNKIILIESKGGKWK